MMEWWVTAAATSAGYVAKYWEQFNSKEKEKEGSSEPVSGDSVYENSDSRKLYQKFRDQTLPLPKSGQKQQLSKKDVRDGYFPEMNNRDGETGLASTSGDVLDNNVLSLMNLSTGVCGRESFQEIGYGEMGPIRVTRDRNVGFIVKPVNSLESCLMAQLYKERGRVDQYVYSSVALPSVSTVRPLLVTNGRRIISRGSSEVRRESGLEEKEMLSRMCSIELRRRSKVSFARQRRSSRFSISTTRASEGAYHSQGVSNGILLFFLGITIGIMSTVVSSEREMDKLNERLKQSESLVQDLQEELEMKEFSTIKELTNKDLESPTKNENSNEQESGKPTNDDSKEIGKNMTEKAELMNSIEAELEAELEKLELSMESSRLERMCKLAELDPGYVADMVQGEVETDRIDSDQDASGTSTSELDPSNYSVPPMELSLRLHELIQSRLESRISELEAALKSSKQRRHSMGSIPRRMLHSESDQSLFTDDETPVEGGDIDQPVVMNLSGEALDAYNEAYEEMSTIIDVDEDNSLETMHESDHSQKEIEMRSKIWGDDEERRLRDVVLDKVGAAEEKISRSWSSESEEEGNDEIEKLLIKQIVERKKGSDAILNVQQMLNLMKDQ